MLLLGHQQGRRSTPNDRFAERVEVRKKDILLFEYLFQAWNNPFQVKMFGASKVSSSHSKDGKWSYSFIRI